MILRPGMLAAVMAPLLSSCGGTAATNLARAVVDTLSGGIPRVTSSGPTAWTDSAGARLVEEARWSGEEGTPSELGEPQSLAVDAEGRTYVVDTKPSVIKVYAADGRFVRTIGGEGEGPGEFRVGFIAVRGKHIALHDPRVARTSVWDTSGAFLRSWHSSCCYWSDIQIDRNERIYVPSTYADRPVVGPGQKEKNRGTPLVRWSLEGEALDSVWVPSRPTEKFWTVSVKGSDGRMRLSMSLGIPLLPSLLYGLHPDGGFVHGWAGAYSLIRTATGGDTLRVFGRAWTPETISEERRRAEVESRVRQFAQSYGEANLTASFKVEDIPATLPAFSGLKVDELGRVWVRRHPVSLADTSRTTFDVFDSTGAFLGPVTAPVKVPDYGMQVWTRDGFVTLIEDQEGRPTVVRFRLDFAPPRT